MSAVGIADFVPLTLDLMVAAIAVLVLLADLFSKDDQPKRWLGYLTAVLLAMVLGASFSTNTEGWAFFETYSGGAWPLFFKQVFLVTALLATLGSIDHVARHQPHRQGEYYVLLCFSLLGMMLLPGARDLLLLVVCFELMGIPLFVLAAYAKRDEPGAHAPEAALKLYVVGVASTAVTLFGLSLVFGLSGETDIATIASAPASPLLLVGMLMVLGGMGFKLGMVPFHAWVPDTYQGASTPFVAFLSVAPKLGGFAALANLFFIGFLARSEQWLPIVAGLCLVTMLVGNLMALAQSSVKRLLGYSGVAHIGYMLLAFAAGGSDGAAMLLFYAVAYAFTNLGAFLVVEAVLSEPGSVRDDDSIARFDGLGRRSPWLGLAMLVFLLSLAGIPFVVGFWAKLYVFVAAWQARLHILVLVGAVLAVVALFYYLGVARAIYMKPPSTERRLKVPSELSLAIAACMLFVVLLGLFPGALLQRAEQAASSFFVGPTQAARPAELLVGRERLPPSAHADAFAAKRSR